MRQIFIFKTLKYNEFTYIYSILFQNVCANECNYMQKNI